MSSIVRSVRCAVTVAGGASQVKPNALGATWEILVRVVYMLTLLMISGCVGRSARHSLPAPGDTPLPCRLTESTRAPDNVVAMQRADSNPYRQALMQRVSQQSGLVDTLIILSPDSVLIHVGSAIPDAELIRTEERDSSGRLVPGALTWSAIEDLSVAQFREAGLTGLRVGRTRIVLSVYSIDSTVSIHAPPSCLPVRVVP